MLRFDIQFKNISFFIIFFCRTRLQRGSHARAGVAHQISSLEVIIVISSIILCNVFYHSYCHINHHIMRCILSSILLTKYFFFRLLDNRDDASETGEQLYWNMYQNTKCKIQNTKCKIQNTKCKLQNTN